MLIGAGAPNPRSTPGSQALMQPVAPNRQRTKRTTRQDSLSLDIVVRLDAYLLIRHVDVSHLCKLPHVWLLNASPADHLPTERSVRALYSTKQFVST